MAPEPENPRLHIRVRNASRLWMRWERLCRCLHFSIEKMVRWYVTCIERLWNLPLPIKLPDSGCDLPLAMFSAIGEV
jgi:hypothetical protein